MEHHPRPPVADETLVKRVGTGDRQALAKLFLRHRDFVFRVAFGSCGDREAAVDMVQEVFIALLRQASTFQAGRARLTTWLYRVTVNKVKDRRRREAAAAASPMNNAVEQSVECGQNVALLNKERLRMLARAVANLPPRPREVFVLRIGLCLSVERTAEYLGTGKGAVRTALHTARRLLQKSLDRAQSSGGSHARHYVSG